MSDDEDWVDEFDADGNCQAHDDCDERDHTCGCGECCDACWFDCCASAQGIETAIDMAVDFKEPVTNCGLTPLAQLDFLINEWVQRTGKEPMTDNDPEPRARARRTDPQTSHDAANSLPSDRIRASQNAVLSFLRRHGAMCDADLVARYDGEPQQSPSGLRTRRKELERRGLVVDTGTQTLLPSGRWATVWGVVGG